MLIILIYLLLSLFVVLRTVIEKKVDALGMMIAAFLVGSGFGLIAYKNHFYFVWNIIYILPIITLISTTLFITRVYKMKSVDNISVFIGTLTFLCSLALGINFLA